MFVEILVGLGGAEPVDTYKIFKETGNLVAQVAHRYRFHLTEGDRFDSRGFLKEFE